MAKHQITIKTGTDYDSTWHHFEAETGAELQQALVEFYALDPVEGEESPFDTTLRAEVVAQGVSAAAHGLGGRVVTGEPSEGGDPWDRTPAAKQPKDPNAELLAEIEETENVADLRELYVENTVALQGSEELMAAWKAKGIALSAAASEESDEAGE